MMPKSVGAWMVFFTAINEDQSKISVLGNEATLEAYLSAIKAGKTPWARDVFILFYLQLIEGIEVTYSWPKEPTPIMIQQHF